MKKNNDRNPILDPAVLLIIMISGLALISMSGCASLKTAVHSNWLAESSHRIAVLPFSGEDPFGEELADALVTELVSARFPVMERSRLMQIMKEQTLQYSGAADPLSLAKTGRLAGVDFIVMGSVTTRPVTPALEWLLGDGRSHDQIDIVRVRWVSVQNGQVMASTTFRNARGGKLETIAKRITKSLNREIQTMVRIQENNKEARPNFGSSALYAYQNKM